METKKLEENHCEKSLSSSSSNEEDKKENENEIKINEEEKDDKQNEEENKSYFQIMKDYFKGSKPKEQNPLSLDEDRTIEEIISSKGYRVQKQLVKTEDGYILTIYRIPGLKKDPISSTKPPVLFQHGIFDSSDGWVCNGEEHSLPFIFAKNNFDVYISNSRGNKYCKEHEIYDSTSFEFGAISYTFIFLINLCIEILLIILSAVPILESLATGANATNNLILFL